MNHLQSIYIAHASFHKQDQLGVHGNIGITLMTSKNKPGFGFVKGNFYKLHLYRGKQTPHNNNKERKNQKPDFCYLIFADSQMHQAFEFEKQLNSRGIKRVPCPVQLFNET